MGWAMITMVEGISRAEGGIGALILNQNKHFLLAEVYAILLVILVLGLLLDYAMGVLAQRPLPVRAAFDRMARRLTGVAARTSVAASTSRTSALTLGGRA